MSQSGTIINDSSIPADVATSYVTNSGTAVPLAHVLNVLGGAGIVVSGAGNTVTITESNPPSPPTPLRNISGVDDFISKTTAGFYQWKSIGAGIQKIPGTTTNPGLVQAQDGGPGSSWAMCINELSANIPTPFKLGGGTLSTFFVLDLVTLSNVGNRYIFYTGLSDIDDSWVSGKPVNGCFFQYSDNVNSGNWQIICGSASTYTTVNTSVAATTGFHNYAVSVNANATLVTFYIDGVSAGTISTNIPTSILSPFNASESALGSPDLTIIDLFYYNEALTSSRPGDQGGAGGGSPGTGTVTGPITSTDNAIARWDGVTGTIIQDSVVSLSDTGVLSGLSPLSVSQGGTGLSSAGTSGNVLSSNGSAFVSSTPQTYTVTGSLTNAQIKALHATPVQVIAAPGAGSFIKFISASANLVYGGSNAFTNAGGQPISLAYNTSVGLTLVPSAQITATANQTVVYQVPVALAAATTTYDNVAINMYNSNATEIAGNAANNNTITYSIMYQIITI